MELVKVVNNEIVVAEEIITEIVEFEKKALEMKLKQDELKKNIKEVMEENGITSWTSPDERLKVSYRKASTRKSLDSKRLKEDLPDIFEEYSKTSNVSSSISISVE